MNAWARRLRMSSRCCAPSTSTTALVEALKGHRFEAAIDGSSIAVSGYSRFFGEMHRD